MLHLLSPLQVLGLASQVELMVNNLYANAGDLRHPGSVPVSGKSPEGGHGNLQLGPVFLPGSMD